MSAMPQSFLGAAANDTDAQETREWLEALDAVCLLDRGRVGQLGLAGNGPKFDTKFGNFQIVRVDFVLWETTTRSINDRAQHRYGTPG